LKPDQNLVDKGKRIYPEFTVAWRGRHKRGNRPAGQLYGWQVLPCRWTLWPYKGRCLTC